MANNNGKSSLFIGDLAIFCSEREIEEAFSPYGEIQEIKIMRSEETSRNLSYGFIKFSSAQAAKRAMTELNGVILCGRPLRIRWATYKSKLGSKEPKQDVLETSPVHVSFISYQIDKLVTEESLRELFSKYGLVVDASIKKSMIDTDVRRQSGYGFVHYSITGEGIHAAIRAASSLDDITVESVNYKCSLSHNLNKYLTGELTMPAEDSQVPGMQSHGAGGGGGGGGAYQDDLGLVDSDQFFHSPPQPQQSLYNVTLPPPGAGPHLYGGRQQTSNQGPTPGMYQSQYNAPQNALYQQTGPKYVNQVPQAARNRPPMAPPLMNGRPRSMNGYQDLQNQLQQQAQYDSQYDNNVGYEPRMEQQYGARFENQHAGHDSRYKLPSQAQGQGPYGRQPLQHNGQYGNVYGEPDRDHQQQQLQGVFARGSLAQQRSSGTSNPNNLLSAAVNGAYNQQQGRGGQYSSGSATLAASTGQQGQLRSGVAPAGYGQAPGQGQGQSQARVVSAPNLMAASGQGGVNGAASNRWSTGSYNVVPPPPVQVPSAHGTNSLRGAPGQPIGAKPVIAPKPQSQYLQGQNNYNNSNSNNNNGYQNPQQGQGYGGYGNNSDYPQSNYGDLTLNTNFSNMNLSQQQQGQNQGQAQQQFGNVFQMGAPMYANVNSGTMLHAGGMAVNLSPPPSPLLSNGTFVASPLMGNATLFNPFQQGFSPLFTTVQGQLSPYVAAAQMSPLMSPGQLMPRDVMFEENISNVHNLFTPATYYASPVMAMRDVHYSPAMFQGNFTTAPNAFQGQNQQGQGQQGQSQGQGFNVQQYGNQRKFVQKTELKGRADAAAASTSTSSTGAQPAASTTPVTTEGGEHPTERTSEEAHRSPEAEDGFFGAASAEGSPLEPEGGLESEDHAGTEHNQEGEGEIGASELDCGDATTSESHQSSAASSSGESLGAPPGMAAHANNTNGATESPNKALGSARRSMIMKHAKQLVA